MSFKTLAGIDPLRLLLLQSRPIIIFLSSSVEIGWKRNSPLSVFRSEGIIGCLKSIGILIPQIWKGIDQDCSLTES